VLAFDMSSIILGEFFSNTFTYSYIISPVIHGAMEVDINGAIVILDESQYFSQPHLINFNSYNLLFDKVTIFWTIFGAKEFITQCVLNGVRVYCKRN